MNSWPVTFLWPQLLWLLLALPLLVLLYVWLLRRRKQAALRFASLSIVREAMGKGPGWRRHVPPVLLLLAIGLMLLASARPMATIVLPSTQQTIILAMDVSGSMRAEDVKPNRLVASQNAAKAFLAELPRHVKVGIVAFAGSAQVVQPVTLSREDLVAAIDKFQLQRATAIGSAIVVSLSELFPEQRINLGDMTYSRNTDPFAPKGRSIDQPKPDEKTFTPVAPGSYTSAAPPAWTPPRPQRWRPSAACASTPWAWARSTARSSDSRAGPCACGSTRKASRKWPAPRRPSTTTPAPPRTSRRSTRP
jgi:Ca-activated chloride channel homolog